MRLEYRVLELAKEDKKECNYCFLDYNDPTHLHFDTAPATHEMVALEENGGYADIVFICKDCKRDYDNDTLPWCEECGRLKRNRNRCYCHHLAKNKSTKSLTAEELVAQSFGSHLEKKTRELENELSTTKEELKIEREEIAKFQEKSEEWGKRQKQELLDKIKQQEAEIELLKKLTPQELVNEIESYKEEIAWLKTQLEKLNSQQSTQIEVKKWSWSKIRK